MSVPTFKSHKVYIQGIKQQKNLFMYIGVKLDDMHMCGKAEECSETKELIFIGFTCQRIFSQISFPLSLLFGQDAGRCPKR